MFLEFRENWSTGTSTMRCCMGTFSPKKLNGKMSGSKCSRRPKNWIQMHSDSSMTTMFCSTKLISKRYLFKLLLMFFHKLLMINAVLRFTKLYFNRATQTYMQTCWQCCSDVSSTKILHWISNLSFYFMCSW